MFDRMSLWVSAGVMTAGLSAALLAGAGVAVAETGTAATETTTLSETPDRETTTETDVETPGDDAADQDAGEDTDEEAGQDLDEEAGQDLDEEAGAGDDLGEQAPTDVDENLDEDAPGDDVPEVDDDRNDTGHHDQTPPTTEPRDTPPVAVETDPEPAAAETTTPPAAQEKAQPIVENSVFVTVDSDASGAQDVGVTEPESTVTRLSMVSAPEASEQAAAPVRQTLLSIIGTVIFNVYNFAIRLLGGPAVLPLGSRVSVHSSSLFIDCGDGYEVPADWYVPDGETPTRMIYLQHGFLAAGPFYSFTAARLAEATHSVVVTTSLTSNFLACDGCWVGGTQMHKAVANLFEDGNTALSDSALAAGYTAALPTKVVLMGHSAGGGLAAGAAGYMAQDGHLDRLAGVVMLDGVGFGDVMDEALAKLPEDLPIYNLSGKSYFWNLSGAANKALEKARPGSFYGVRLDGGLHSDTMVAGNPLIQFGLYLVTGFSKPKNVEAAETLSAAWANDMFDGIAPTVVTTASDHYGPPESTLEIDSGWLGTATAYVSPGPKERLTFIDWLFSLGSKIVFGIDFATCAVDPEENQEEIAAPNTLLSLDGRAKAGQSIGQQCVHG